MAREYSRTLTDNEKQLLAHLSNGGTYREFAVQESVGIDAIHNRMKRIKIRMGVASTEQVIYRWAETQPRKKVPLPHTRLSRTHKVTIYSEHGDAKIFITAGQYEGGRIGELFVNIGLQGSTLRGTLDAWARMVSVSLQWGVPVEDIIDKFKAVAFEPSGPTSNPDIPKCTSVIDYTVRWLEQEVNRGK